MCHKSAPAKTLIKEETIASLKRAQKTRSKTRKPKFLSLNQELSPENIIMAHHKQLNLFPLHPQNQVEGFNKDRMHEENDVASYLLDSDSGGSLNGLLDGCDTSATRVSSEEDSLTYGYRGQESSDASNSLVRTAMRSRERELREEKWVCYSEVMVEKKVEEEVSSSSCAVDGRCSENRTAERGLLALKLDYQEILNAWSDKGPLYVDGESPQTVPDLHDTYDSPSALMDGRGNGENNGGLWRVPGVEGKEERWKMGQREASVMRYKEKRQNRLFSKRIRYQVRKLNAEKRPRIKGRFVKI